MGIKVEEDSEIRQMWLYFTGNFATSSFTIFVVIIGVVLLLTLFVMSRTVLCPDFARQQKNTQWYCLTEEDKEKMQQNKSNLVIPPPP